MKIRHWISLAHPGPTTPLMQVAAEDCWSYFGNEPRDVRGALLVNPNKHPFDPQTLLDAKPVVDKYAKTKLKGKL